MAPSSLGNQDQSREIFTWLLSLICLKVDADVVCSIDKRIVYYILYLASYAICLANVTDISITGISF